MITRTGQPQLFNIPVHAAFADALVAGLLHRVAGDVMALAQSLVLLPNRRAVTAVTEAFVRQLDGGGLLLPRLVPVGDLDDTGFDRLAAGEAPIAPAVPLLVRRFELAQLAGKLPGAARAVVERLRLGDALGDVLDALLAEEIDPEALRSAADGQDLADHWQKSLAFLELIIAAWPQARTGHGGIEGATRLATMIYALIARWQAAPPMGLVVAAGIANPTPAIVRLLSAVLALPRGLVVLPGLDGDAGPAGHARWDAIRLADAETGQRGDPGHPQWAMKLLLASLGLERHDVQAWPATGGALDGPAARGAALVAALAPAAAAAAQPEPDAQAFANVTLAECATAAEEAQVAALALREAVETPGVRAALITPDPDLARRVAAHCQRWGIAIDSSAGTPLALMPPGALAQDLVAAMAEAFAPARLLAALKHSLVRRGEPGFAASVMLADLALRGVRPPPGLDAAGEAIARFVADHRGPQAEVMALWWDDVAAALTPLEQLREARSADLPTVMAALRHAVTALTGDDGWSGPDGRQLGALVAEVEACGSLFGPFQPDEAPALLAALMHGCNVRVPGQGHPRLAILGPVEAQLTRADVIILAGLNEGSWPGQPAPDPWLAPAIRARLGLAGTARAQGMAAQDFVRAAAAPKVLITRARRDAGGPRLPSRLWLRLLAHAERGGSRLRRRDDLVALARALDGAAAPRPQPPPSPNPPLALRPRSLSITEIDTLIADPFAFHARRVLQLRALDPLDQDPTAAMRGTLVHDVLERWIDDGHASIVQLEQIIVAELEREAAHFPLLAAAWVPRMRAALHWAGLEIIKRQNAGWNQLVAEANGRLELTGGIMLTGRVDRVDRSESGEYLVVDYKTGTPPAKTRVRALLANQLALGLAMAAKAALEKNGQGLPAGTPISIEYWQLQGARNKPGMVHTPLDGKQPIDAADHVEAALAHAGELAAHYLLAQNPFEPKLRPEWAWGDYDHLARVPEWISRPRPSAQPKPDAERGGGL